MTSEEFVHQLRRSIVEENVSIYKDLFASTNVKDVNDPYWVRALRLYATLDNEQKSVLLEVVRQVMVDTVSNVLAVLDGVSRLERQEEDFTLLADSTAEKLNGELQDRFLELEEDS